MSRNPAKGTGTAKNLREIFTAALACDDAKAREQLLEHECNGDDILRGKVELLLEESTMVGDFLERGIAFIVNPGGSEEVTARV